MATEVLIFDKSYKLECPAHEEPKLHAAAQALESKYREARHAMPRLEPERVAGMVAFNLSLEYAKLEHNFKVLSEEITKEKRQSEELIHKLSAEIKAVLADK